MQRKIYRLLATDFCCWVPISVMAFINFAGVPLSGIVYVVSAIVLLPVNSALNPILYSDVVDKFIQVVRKRISRKHRSETKSKQNNTQMTNVSEGGKISSGKKELNSER